MSSPVQFRFDDSLLRLLDERARAERVTRAALLREIVTRALHHNQDLNVARLNQVTEYNAAAIGILVEHIIGDKQPEIIAIVAKRLEQFHGQR